MRKKLSDELRQSKAFAKPGAFEFRIVLDGLKPTYNIGKIFRSSEGFGVGGVDLINIPEFNPYPAMGSIRRIPIAQYKNFQECKESLLKQGYTIFALDPSATATLQTTNLPDKSAFVFGHEETGLSFKPDEHPEVKFLKIQTFGVVQSLNVSIAASITMYEYVRNRSLSEF